MWNNGKEFPCGGWGWGWGNRQQQAGKSHYRDWLVLCTLFGTLHKVTQICWCHCGPCIMIVLIQKGRDQRKFVLSVFKCLGQVWNPILQFVPNMSTRHPRTWSPTSSFGIPVYLWLCLYYYTIVLSVCFSQICTISGPVYLYDLGVFCMPKYWACENYGKK